jgi:histidyl-tRNA synthetase
MAVARELRSAGLEVIMGAAGRSLKSQMRQAGAVDARFAIIIGGEELASGNLTLRDFAKASQDSVTVDEAKSRLLEPT